MFYKHIFALMCLSALCVFSAGAKDARIKIIPYKDDMIVRISGCLNFQTMLRFGPHEKIENVGLGDASQWQITPNKRADLLFIKPLISKAFSNMSVVTNLHTYDFELRMKSAGACTRGDVVYDMRFSYPPEPPATTTDKKTSAVKKDLLPPAEKRNTAYSYKGEKNLIPLRVFDDGNSTYMKWGKGVPVPAIYAMAPDGEKSLINFQPRGAYIVIQQLAHAFTLRRGTHQATLINDHFVTPQLDDKSPQPAKPEKQEDSLWPF